MNILPDCPIQRAAGHANVASFLRTIALLALVSCSAASLGFAQQSVDSPPDAEVEATVSEASDSYVPVSAVDPDIPSDQLIVLVKPLTLDEVTAEADEWFKLLREKSGEIAADQLAVKEQNASAEASDSQSADEKQQRLDELTELKLQQTSLIEKLNVVLDSVEAKGGDVAEYRSYISAQRGVNIDATDTAATWAAIKGWLKSEEGGVKWAWRIANFCLILFVTRILTGFISRLIKRWLDKTSHMSKLAEDLIARSIRNLLMALGLMVALTALGVDVGPLLAALGATGFIIGFALQGTLSNFASGLMILLNRPFDVGDVVEAGGVSGKVSEMNLVSTTFSTFDNQKIIVPNNEIWDNVITNVTARSTRRVDLVFGVGYGDDLKKVISILNEITAAHPLVLQDPAPTIKLNELADSSVNFICRPWAKTEDYWTVYWDLLETAKERFDAEGISIPYPQRDIHVHNA
jgi:small conductance mechanosensitive channel